MKVILLSGNKVALVDDQDFAFISKWGWRAEANHSRSTHKKVWYAARTEKGTDGRKRTIYMHRELLGLVPHDGIKTDHRDGDGLNNQRFNLRRADSSTNAMNVRKQDGTSRFKGVYLDKRDQLWQANITVGRAESP